MRFDRMSKVIHRLVELAGGYPHAFRMTATGSCRRERPDLILPLRQPARQVTDISGDLWSTDALPEPERSQKAACNMT